MRSLALALAALLALSVAGCASSSGASTDELPGFIPIQNRPKQAVDPATIPCPLLRADEDFLARVLRGYRDALRAAKLPERPLPWTVAVGRECVYQLAPRRPLEGGKYLTTGLMWNASPVIVHAAGHAGEVTLPDGGRIERGTYLTAQRTSDYELFVLSLPELWPKPADEGEDAVTPLVERAVAELMRLTTSESAPAEMVH